LRTVVEELFAILEVETSWQSKLVL
jgi:hypothetical protein